jgi:hypothetical protein
VITSCVRVNEYIANIGQDSGLVGCKHCFVGRVFPDVSKDCNLHHVQCQAMQGDTKCISRAEGRYEPRGPSWCSRCGDQTVGWRTHTSWFDSRSEQDIFLSSEAHRIALGPTQTPAQ